MTLICIIQSLASQHAPGMGGEKGSNPMDKSQCVSQTRRYIKRIVAIYCRAAIRYSVLQCSGTYTQL